MTLTHHFMRWRNADPRWFQIAFLSLFLAAVVGRGGFSLAAPAMLTIFLSAAATQTLFVRLFRLPQPGYLSVTISSLSLCLLLRANGLVVPAAAAFLAIASKFLCRLQGKHLFNPTNFGLLMAVLLTDRAWVSPGQWGSEVVLAFFLAALGLMVVRKVGRLDITLGYLVIHATLLLARFAVLGESSAVVVHRLANGALILFAFFMISDPRSTPDSRVGRIVFAALVATVGHVLRFHYFIPSAPLWALLVVSPVTPLLDRMLKGTRFAWAEKGAPHDAQPPVIA